MAATPKAVRAVSDRLALLNVKTVNAKAPDASGNVQLSSADIGAFPAEGGMAGNKGIDTTKPGVVKDQGYRVYSPLNPPPQSPTTTADFTRGWWKDTVTGFIIQGSQGNFVRDTVIDVPFPIVFPARCLHVSVSVSTSTWGPNYYAVFVSKITETEFKLQVNGIVSGPMRFMAFGV